MHGVRPTRVKAKPLNTHGCVYITSASVVFKAVTPICGKEYPRPACDTHAHMPVLARELQSTTRVAASDAPLPAQCRAPTNLPSHSQPRPAPTGPTVHS